MRQIEAGRCREGSRELNDSSVIASGTHALLLSLSRSVNTQLSKFDEVCPFLSLQICKKKKKGGEGGHSRLKLGSCRCFRVIVLRVKYEAEVYHRGSCSFPSSAFTAPWKPRLDVLSVLLLFLGLLRFSPLVFVSLPCFSLILVLRVRLRGV